MAARLAGPPRWPGLSKCSEGRPDADQWGVRFFAGQWADAYLERRPPQPGTAVVVCRGTRHVADPCDFTDDELAGCWADVRTAAKAIEHAYRPCQLNYATLGNAVPHVHTHIATRYPTTPPLAAPCRTGSSPTPANSPPPSFRRRSRTCSGTQPPWQPRPTCPGRTGMMKPSQEMATAATTDEIGAVVLSD